LNTNLGYWGNVNWQRKEVILEDLNIAQSTSSRIQLMLKAYVEGEQNGYYQALGKRGRERFHIQLHQLIDNGVFPCPLVFVDHGQGYDLMDGNHRLSAYCAWKMFKKDEKSVVSG
jgi:hypothetical protein